jgi:membrane peptidoglycan carboxypeptidase
VIDCLQRFARDRYRLALWLRRGANLAEFDQHFVHMVLVAEDKRYWSHRGIDWIAVARALLWQLVGKPNGGASTIEMQLVRTVTHRRERTMRRKIREMILAAKVSQFASKSEILTTYLNSAYFGHDQIGAETASRSVFRSGVANICLPRKAFLAALLVWPLPSSRNLGWYRRAFRRTRWIIFRFDHIPIGTLTKHQSHPHPPQRRCSE